MAQQFQGLTAEMYRAVVAIVDDRMREIRVVRQEFDRLVAVSYTHLTLPTIYSV